jgi:excisionase family DNA binding protein
VGEVLLLTPGQAAEVLQVRESWLRRRAAERRVPCCFVGKHLRFSRADLEAIVADGARPARDAVPRHGRRSRDGGRPGGSPDGRV